MIVKLTCLTVDHALGCLQAFRSEYPEIKAVRYGRSIIFNDDQTNQAFQLFKMKQVVINMMVDESETLTQFEIDLLNV